MTTQIDKNRVKRSAPEAGFQAVYGGSAHHWGQFPTFEGKTDSHGRLFTKWTARAQQFGWKVSTKASMGAIINLQPWVQGAYGLGHVAVVEKVYSDGSVLASNMSWGSNPYAVVYVHFYPGSGVTFIQI